MICKTLFTAACVVATAMPAAAAPAVNSTIDLRTLRVSVVDTDAADGLEAAMQSSAAGRSAWVCEGPVRPAGCDFGNFGAETTQDPAVTASDSLAVPGSWDGLAVAAPDRLSSDVTGTGTTGPTGTNTALLQNFWFDGAGRFTVEVDYSLSASGLDGITFREVYAWAGIIFFGTQGFAQAEEWLAAPASGTAARSGTLSFSRDFQHGDFIQAFIHTHVHTLSPIAAPVPEPATWALMLAGLAGIGVVCRRRT